MSIKTQASRILSLLLAVCLILAASHLAETAETSARSSYGEPWVSSPIIGAFTGKPAELKGGDFGAPGPESALLVRTGQTQFSLPSTSSWIRVWEDDRIVVDVPQTAQSGWLRVLTPDGVSGPVRVDVFEYDWFDIPPTHGTNALPLAITVDQLHRVWVNQEFHLEFQVLDPSLGEVRGLPIPKPPDPGPFASTMFGDHRTQMSILGEDIIVDPQGRIWFTQGGGHLYFGIHPNHSRIVCFDPNGLPGERYRVYNVPGDWNEVIGLAWDPIRERMWFANAGMEIGAHIVSFDPERIPYDNHFDFSEALWHQVCQQGQPDDSCYHVYPLPRERCYPAHLVVADDGYVWYTAYWGNGIGRLDPETGEVEEYPLPDPIGQGAPVPFVGCGPWQLVIAENGDVIFNEFFDNTIGRFDISRLGDPECLQLDPDSCNPCIDERVVPDADQVNERVHSIAFDLDGNLWFTQHGAQQHDEYVSVGFVTADQRHIIRLPPMSMFPGDGAASGAGIAVDAETGDIWFSEFYRKRIGRLRKVPEPLALSSPASETTGWTQSTGDPMVAAGHLSPDLTWSRISLPRDFKLQQNSPNPFNAATVIQYDLPQPSWVNIEVFNILGERVRTLVDEFQEAGYRNILWDGRSEGGGEVSSGVYFYRLQAGDFTSVKRMSLVR
ncbi:MAG: T9SS type A sorting domain-containing protein [Candidatus Zixiibacteriota bacterium]